MVSRNQPRTVIIIGGGFSGAITAVHIARLAGKEAVHVILVDPRGFGRGVAYDTNCIGHVLNVPAGGMSAFPEDPDHFVAWARRRDPKIESGSFVPRSWYGEYIAELVNEAREEFGIENVRARAVDLRLDASGVRVALEDGRWLRGDRVVIAAGNFAPLDPPIAGLESLKNAYVRDPWSADALSDLAPHQAVLLVGTGLTMVDVAVALRSSGHTGSIHAVSRRGLLPQGHRPARLQVKIAAPREVLQAPRTALELLRGLRAAVKREAANGNDWRDVFAALRSFTPLIWQNLPQLERERFLRHLRVYWDIHRHRLAPEVATSLRLMRLDGQLNVQAGRILRARPHANGATVHIRPRGSDKGTDLNVARIINCTGPASDVRQLADPLWRSLLRRRLVRPDDLGLGLLTAPDGALLDGQGRPSDSLFLVGPLRKAQLWESTAVPELRTQVRQIAQRVLESDGAGGESTEASLRRRLAVAGRPR
jgi:uncharacterized NAD(P)/FAD-binding protein YdhS